MPSSPPSYLSAAPPPVLYESARGIYPEWVFLDTVASGANYLSKSYAVAAASTTTTANVSVKFKQQVGVELDVDVEVSFRLFEPPDVSRFFVHCRGLRNDGLAHSARVVSAERDIVLLYITLARNKAGRYFVYRAGRGNSTLEVLPSPSRFFHRTKVVGILPRGTDGYVVAAIMPMFAHDDLKYKLYLYSSKTKAWSTKLAPLYCDSDDDLSCAWNHTTHKVITVGGDSLGWVDLWWGILVCNVLNEEDHVVRVIQLPDQMPGNDRHFGISSARSCRDVICIGDSVKFVEVDYHGNYNNLDHDCIDYGWKAITWKRILSSKDWHKCLTIDTDDIKVTDERYSYLLPELWDDKAKKLPLNKFAFSAPTLSLDDDVFYMMST